ncbi:Protein of unknown function [Pyronema omphalodes CBS 100304]|uniref:Uncharacterized protein n=1 Tax=Pyronema omphalodes (strain CBS 100304) TaxID=1076935 RepID=U4LAG4_PYROM|nr:Protein of unknown function [Pyronema omphalodes CBS 100304]
MRSPSIFLFLIGVLVSPAVSSSHIVHSTQFTLYSEPGFKGDFYSKTRVRDGRDKQPCWTGEYKTGPPVKFERTVGYSVSGGCCEFFEGYKCEQDKHLFTAFDRSHNKLPPVHLNRIGSIMCDHPSCKEHWQRG